MGCGASKMQSEEEAKYRPILRRRLEEFMARRNASGLSKKQLLAGEGILPHEYEEVEDVKTTTNKEVEIKDCPPSPHIFHDTQDSPPSPQKMAPLSNTHENNKVHNDKNVDDHHNNGNKTHSRNNSTINDLNDYKIDDVIHDHHDNDDDDHVDNKVVVDDDDEQKCKENNKDDDDDDDDVGEEEKKGGVHEVQVNNKELLQQEDQEEAKRRSVDDDDGVEEGMEFCPGSPSFRVYCVNNNSDEELEDTAETHQCEDCDNKQEDENDCIRQESSNSNEVVDEKKHKRKSKFKKLSIPKGGKKVLHSMHSFYNFPCNSNNSRLMEQETVPQPKPNAKEV